MNNRRSFLKKTLLAIGCIPVTANIALVAKPVRAIELVKAPSHKLVFNQSYIVISERYHIRVIATDQILIQLPDGTFELNIYGEYYKVAAIVTILNKGNIVWKQRLESDLLLVKNYDSEIDKQTKDILEKVNNIINERSSYTT